MRHPRRQAVHADFHAILRRLMTLAAQPQDGVIPDLPFPLVWTMAINELGR
jgi:hypothetical protein